MDDVIVWIIIAAFYAPLHYIGPLGLVVLTVPDSSQRKQLIRYALIESTISMLLAFALVIWLARSEMFMAMIILMLSMLVPYPILLLQRRALMRTGS